MSALNPYHLRSLALTKLGFLNYKHYLKSKLWKRIRRKILRRDGYCRVCGSRYSTQVHHLSYSINTLQGGNLDFLVGLCGECHRWIEFEAEGKTTLQEANEKGGFSHIVENEKPEKWVKRLKSKRRRDKRANKRAKALRKADRRRERKIRGKLRPLRPRADLPDGYRVCRACFSKKKIEEFRSDRGRSCSVCLDRRMENRKARKAREAEDAAPKQRSEAAFLDEVRAKNKKTRRYD